MKAGRFKVIKNGMGQGRRAFSVKGLFVLAVVLGFVSGSVASIVQAQQTYHNEEYGFSIEPPSGWTVNESGLMETAVIFYGPIGENFAVDFAIKVLDAAGMTLNEVVNADKQNASLSLTNFTLLSEQSRIIDNIDAYEIVYTFTLEEFDVKSKAVYLLKDDRVYAIDFAAIPPGNYDEYLPTFEASVETFKIEPKPPMNWLLIVGIIVAVLVIIGMAGAIAFARFRKQPKVKKAPPREIMKRPTGLTIIAILWLLGGLYNLYISSQTINSDLGVLSSLYGWFKFGVPAELAISLLVFALGLAQMFTIYGLWTGKSWSYKLALAIPVLGVVISISLVGLYMSAPIELGIRESINWVLVGSSIFWAIIYWSYLRRPHVKEYLGV